jgi:ParB family chromosome partitioning protein
MNVKEQPRRLGRGLAALLGDAAVPVSVVAPGVQQLAVDVLEPSPYQPRKEMDDTALGELADSIAQRGILQPLLVRPHPARDGFYQIIAGERRWRAAQRARLHEVPVLVRALSDSDAMAAGLVENLQREDLNPIEEAEGYRRLMVEFQVTQDALGEAIGKSRAHISNALRILKLPEKVLAMVRDGRLSAGHAKALLGHDQPEKGAKLVLEKDWSVRQTEQYVGDLGRSIPYSAQKNRVRGIKSTEVDALAAHIMERIGMKVSIRFEGRKGAITIHYENLDQMDSLLKLLGG